MVFPTAIFMYSNCIPFHWNPNQWVICLHKRVPFTSSHAGVGPQPEDLLIAHIHFAPDAVQNKPTYAERDVESNFPWMLDHSVKLLRSFRVSMFSIPFLIWRLHTVKKLRSAVWFVDYFQFTFGEIILHLKDKQTYMMLLSYCKHVICQTGDMLEVFVHLVNDRSKIQI